MKEKNVEELDKKLDELREKYRKRMDSILTEYAKKKKISKIQAKVALALSTETDLDFELLEIEKEYNSLYKERYFN